MAFEPTVKPVTTSHTGMIEFTDTPLFESTDAVVWWWPVPAGQYRTTDLELLDGSELTRVHKMKSERARAEFITCRAAVRRALSDVFRPSAAEIVLGRTPCPGCGSEEHGPPAVLHPATSARISIAHTQGLGMLALSPFRVGIDVERVRALDVAEVEAPVLTAAERLAVRALPEGPSRTAAFLRCWTRKEAVCKALGIGITTDLTALESHGWTPGPAHTTTTALDSVRTWRMADVPVPEGWTASLALPAGADRPPSVRRLG